MINRCNTDVAGGEHYTEKGKYRKLFIGGDCDNVIKQIVTDAGWSSDLRAMLPDDHQNFL